MNMAASLFGDQGSAIINIGSVKWPDAGPRAAICSSTKTGGRGPSSSRSPVNWGHAKPNFRLPDHSQKKLDGCDI
jgi:hypothetical protein